MSRPFWCEAWPTPPNRGPKSPPLRRLRSPTTSRGAARCATRNWRATRRKTRSRWSVPQRRQPRFGRRFADRVPGHVVGALGRQLDAVEERAVVRLPECPRGVPVDRRALSIDTVRVLGVDRANLDRSVLEGGTPGSSVEADTTTGSPQRAARAAATAAVGRLLTPKGKQNGTIRLVNGAIDAIQLEGLRRDFGERPALAGLSLHLAAGETLLVIGPNGAGKTTLLRVLATLLRPSGGQTVVLGCELPREAWKLRGRVGYLGHEPLLYRELTGRENLRFHARLHGIPQERAERGSTACWPSSGSSDGPTSQPTSSRSGCGSGWHSAAACSTSPSCCCSTSPTRTSTPRVASWPGGAPRPRGRGPASLVTHDAERALPDADRALVSARRRPRARVRGVGSRRRRGAPRSRGGG